MRRTFTPLAERAAPLMPGRDLLGEQGDDGRLNWLVTVLTFELSACYNLHRSVEDVCE